MNLKPSKLYTSKSLKESITVRVDMSKALHLVYTLHPKTLTNPLLTYNLTKQLTLTRLIEKF